MSMTAAWGNMIERHRSRLESERLRNDQEEEEEQAVVTPADINNNNNIPTVEEGRPEHDTANNTNNTNNDNEAEDNTDDNTVVDDDSDDEEAQQEAATTTTTAAALNRMTLSELEEERELARRRSSACVMLAVFVLFRLWIEAIQQGDFGLLLLSLVGTSWTARWIRHNREREEELDRRIAQYLQQQQQQQQGTGGEQVVDRNDLRMLSFQAQLALAIMESQRQMMQGGSADATTATPGVSPQAKSRWEHFDFKMPPKHHKKMTKSGYGSVSQQEGGLTNPSKKAPVLIDDEEPHCSICLCEYEDGETLVRLPCAHFYHDECISSWCSNHVKCPLCNFDLETAPPLSEHSGSDSIV